MRFDLLKFAAAVMGVCLFATGTARAGRILTDFPSVDGNEGTFGTGFTQTYGEVFQVPQGVSFLSDVIFSVENPAASPIPFKLYIYQWGGSGITGNALFTSADQQIPFSGPVYQNIDVSGINLAVNPGEDDVAFFSTLGFGGTAGGAQFASAPVSAYPAGMFVFSNAGTFGGLSRTWGNHNLDSVPGNLGFQLIFDRATLPTNPSPAPEPSPVWLLALGLASFAAAASQARVRMRCVCKRTERPR